ncbi:hypothetical protein EDC04DRAFT_2604081 [Pisolithus marmoratus]|nr:hypothetical protein EDC04DRAFT_2604081 [Pisolithus marmoratus]
MGKDYEMEAMIDDEDGHGDFIVPVPASSFHLKSWTATKMKHSDQLALVCMMNPKAFDIPPVINTFGQPLRLLLDSQAFKSQCGPQSPLLDIYIVPLLWPTTHNILLVTVTHQPHTLATMTIISPKSTVRSIMKIGKDPPQCSGVCLLQPPL